MPSYTYDPGLVFDDVTLLPTKSAVGNFRDVAGGTTQPIYDLNGNPIATLLTNAFGYVARFKADIPDGVLSFGSVVQPCASVESQRAGLTIADLVDDKAPTDGPVFTGTVSGITSAMVGLDQVDNTSDANKPVSTLQAAAMRPYGLRAVEQGVGSSGDQTANIQAVLTGLSAGQELIFDPGTYDFTSLTIAPSNVTVTLRPGAVLNKTVALTDGILITGSDVTVQGPGAVVSPATFDGANAVPTYGVIRVKGDRVKVRGLTLTNVPKVGIYADDVDRVDVQGCTIAGNYPAGSYNDVETGHFGIAFNPGASGSAGRGVISGNSISSCVQGIFVGNYGSAVDAYGLVVTGNDVSRCHNHGIYCAGGVDAITVTGNAFSHCQAAVALTGRGHVVSSNAIYTSNSSGIRQDLAGISLREPVDCAVTGNSIVGDSPLLSAVIDLANYVASSTAMSGNVVSGNTIDIAQGTSSAIRLGRSNQTMLCNNNTIANNVIRGTGRPGNGMITLSPQAGAVCYGNRISGNSITVRSESHGIFVLNAAHVAVTNNTIGFEINSGPAIAVGAVVLSASTLCTVSGNDFYNATGFGTNVALRGIWETTSAASHRYDYNSHDPGSGLTGYVPFLTISGSGALVNHSGVGSPNGAFYALPGSRYARTDGGVSSSLYVKESASTSASGWVSYGAPGALAPQIDTFTASGTWTKPATATSVRIVLISGGGGGGSGRRGAADTIRCGGGGGGGGALTQELYDAADLTATVAVTIGAGGVGGAAVATDSTNGNASAAAGATSFGSYATATVGNPAAGGTATTGTAGTGGVGTTLGSSGGTASTTGLVGGNATSGGGAGGGGAGGGITATAGTNVAGNGGSGLASRSVSATGSAAGGTVDSTAPASGTAPLTKGSPSPGAGGGAASLTTAAQAGANAVGYGGGGGGGGAALNGNNSGAGGNGAPGYALIITTF